MDKQLNIAVYKQSYEQPVHENVIVISSDEYIRIRCKECTDGRFYITEEDWQTCVNCRGAGKVWCNIF